MTEFKVVATLIASLICGEALLSRSETTLSKDVAHLRSLETLGSTVDPNDWLVMGNSLARCGINTETFQSHAAGSHPTMDVARFHPDGSSIAEWRYAWKRAFPADPPALTLFFTGRTHLDDSRTDPARLGAYFVGSDDVGTALGDLPDIDKKAEFLLSRSSKLIANRERLSPRILTALIPHYQSTLREINAVRNAGIRETVTDYTPSHENLQALLDNLKERGAEAAFIALPAKTPYSIAPEAATLIKSSGQHFVDLSSLAGIGPENFPDGHHLDPAGAAIVTDHLVQLLIDG